MITYKQAEARRNNGKLSKGPKTAEGKATSSRNSVRHGFRSRNPLVPGECEEELASFRANLVQSISPAGAMESMLADFLVDAAWQMRRVPAVASGILTAQHYDELAEQAQHEAFLLKIDSSPETRSEDTPDPVKCLDVLRREAEMREATHGPELALGRAFIRDAKGTESLWRLSRYQVSIQRTLFPSLHALHPMQALRAAI